LLRLPLTVEPVFREWLARTQPLKAEKVENYIRRTRGGKLSESTWGKRMRGAGPIAEQINSLFKVFVRKLAFPGLPPQDCSQFRPPQSSGQMTLF
jgi:DNA repair photolyase